MFQYRVFFGLTRKNNLCQKDTKDKEASSSALNQVLGISIKQIRLFISNVAASSRSVVLNDASCETSLSESPLATSSWVSQRERSIDTFHQLFFKISKLIQPWPTLSFVFQLTRWNKFTFSLLLTISKVSLKCLFLAAAMHGNHGFLVQY